jgi:protein-L-isoaspartate(D-aspartate) O-methyltransferase
MRPTDRRAERRGMVRRDLRRRDIVQPRVLAAMATVPREAFVPPEAHQEAYADRPLVIGHGQTISQPYIVALMTQAAALTRRSRVLEVGGGSGYHAAVLARIAGVVWSMERIPELAARARAQLRDAGVRNVHVLHGDGTLGYPPAAPFDAIVVAAAAPAPPPALLTQLAAGGRLVMPVGPPDVQDLVVYERSAAGVREHVLCACCFVPLVTAAGRPPI